MGMFEFTEKDAARDRIVTAGWYPVEIKNIEEKPSKGDKSNNTVVKVEGLSGEAELVEVNCYYNEKAQWAAKKLIQALNGGEPVQVGVKYRLDNSQVGRKLEAFFRPGLYEGRPTNNIEDWRPLTQHDEAVSA